MPVFASEDIRDLTAYDITIKFREIKKTLEGLFIISYVG